MDYEAAVVGGGVIGLAVARALALRGVRTLVLEAEPRLGEHTSSRNSQVIHAGLYYPPRSLKAWACVEGRARLYAFARENGVPHARCGKLVVACAPDEIAALEKLAANARANGVDDIAMMDARDAHALEPEVTCHAALHSPSTGIIDAPALLTALEGQIGANGGEIIARARVCAIEPLADGYSLDCDADGERVRLSVLRIVVAAGHGAVPLMTGLAEAGATRDGYRPPAATFSKGHYFALSGKGPFTRLVYPLPTGAWLGVHATIDLAGAALFGPDHEWTGGIDYTFDDMNGARRARFAESIARFWPRVREDRLQPAYVGVRPRIFAPGETPADFRIDTVEDHGLPGLVALLGIESPGLTASLALAERCADALLET